MKSLEVTVWALQNILSGSSCPSSRMTAEMALRAVGDSGELPNSPSGKPRPIDPDMDDLRAVLRGHVPPSKPR